MAEISVDILIRILDLKEHGKIDVHIITIKGSVCLYSEDDLGPEID